MCSKQQVRIDWVDSSKGILIFLVVLGHFNGLSLPIKHTIYAFHIPAFLFLTGFVSANASSKSFGLWMKGSIVPLVRLYFALSVLSLALWLLIERPPLLGAGSMVAALGGVIYGTHGAERLFLHNNDPLWYLPFFIAVLIGNRLLCRANRFVAWGATLLLAGLSLLYAGPRLPWSLDVLGLGLFYAQLGLEVRRLYDRSDAVKRWLDGQNFALSAVTLVVAAPVLVFVAIGNGEVNFNTFAFGDSKPLFLLASIAGIVLSVHLSCLIGKRIPIGKVGKQTLLIFVTHIYLVKAMKPIVSHFGGGSQLSICLAAIVVTVACYLFARLASSFVETRIMAQARA